MLNVLKNINLWDNDLSLLPGFAEAIYTNINTIIDLGILKAMSALEGKKIDIE